MGTIAAEWQCVVNPQPVRIFHEPVRNLNLNYPFLNRMCAGGPRTLSAVNTKGISQQ